MVLYDPGRTTTWDDDPIERGLRFHYLGGGNEVGNVGCVLDDSTGTRILLDYGIAPTSPPRFPAEAPRVTDAIITHTHIDHVGMAPWLAAQHRTRLHATSFTAAVAPMMWRDSIKISNAEGTPLPYDHRDVDEAEQAWRVHAMWEWQEHGPWRWRFRPAGHIPGAAMIELETSEKRVLFTGDFDTRDCPLVAGAEPTPCDILFVEGTYGGREHVDRAEEVQRFVADILATVSAGGLALVPSFAVGRSQDILLTLHAAAPHLEVHYDGMGRMVTQHMLDHGEHLRDPAALEAAYRWTRRVSSKSDRKKALAANVIVTTSGMLDGGPALWYLNRLRHDPRNRVFLTGYQVEGSGGRRLLDHGRLPIWGKDVEVDLEVERYDFSTHAGHSEIVAFAKACGAQDVVVYHTDPERTRPPLLAALEANGHRVHAPVNGRSVTIE